MKILYLSTWDFSNQAADGVCKKIIAQIVSFEKRGCQVDLTCIKNGRIIYRENGIEQNLGSVRTIKKTSAYIKMYSFLKDKHYDLVYNRYGMMDLFYFRLLKQFYKNQVKILIEIPTYPYVEEKPNGGLLYWLMFKWDEIYINRLKKVVDRVATYSSDREIFGIPAIKIMNGIDVSKINVCTTGKVNESIDLIAVALMQPYHGYERLINGMKQYYDNGGKRKIIFHLVGDGPEKRTYESLVSDNKLEKYVIFYGKKGGLELDEIYNKADLGICTLGGYKKGLFLSSELKSREYLVRGIPIVAGMEIDIFQTLNLNEEFYIQFSNDESLIDIDRVIAFYDKIQSKNKQKVTNEIRTFAENYLSMDAVMQPIFEYLQV